MNYGKAIRTVRAAKNLEQKELAKRADINPSYVSLIEANKRAPSSTALEALAKGLGVPLYLLMLLASEEEDLHGIREPEAAQIGKLLLDVVLASESAPSARRGKR